jgi:RHS repeat-associated protein
VVVGRYLYDPYGNLLAQSGALADANAYRFSSKEYDSVSGLYCYGRRYYDPNLQRWLNRDPIGETGGLNLYGFVGNGPLTHQDVWGFDYYNGEYDDLDRRLEIAKKSSALAATYAYDDETRARHRQIMCEGKEALKRFGLRVAEMPIAPFIAIKNGLNVAFDPTKDPLERWGGACTAIGNAILVVLPFVSEVSVAASELDTAGQEVETLLTESGAARTEEASLEATKVESSSAGGAAAETTAAAGDHIVLGLESQGLQQTATQVGGRTLMTDANWQATLQTSLGNPSTRFTVSLDGVTGTSPYSQFMGAAQQGLGSGAVQGNWFNWEMGQIYQAGRQGSVNFMQGGSVVPNPFH